MASKASTPPASRVPAESIEELLGKLCVTYGFCLHSPHYDQLCDSPPSSAEAFLDAVFRAEGLDPRTADSKLYKPMLEVVRSAFDQHA